ncbi:hypothetical protein [Pseudomonas aeruginosa]|uniref:hypothetical protein n=1 Tax=Pseudomonas aeruginosa TaxID=287 RepID=UPI001EE6E95A|nr:hypothetical protein [Pseudomonas aeruginosa]
MPPWLAAGLPLDEKQGDSVNYFRNTALSTLVFSAALTSGCASIFNDSNTKVEFYSVPTQAEFEIRKVDGQLVGKGTTPGAFTLENSSGYFKKQSYTVTFKKDGYDDVTVPFKPSVSGWYWWNILLGGLIGMLIVDPVTGAMYVLPDDVTANLKEGHGAPTLSVNSIESIPIADRERLVRIN